MIETREQLFELARAWLDQDPDPETGSELTDLIDRVENGDEQSEELLLSRFNSRLAFGTAGIRGPLGCGPGAMNRVVVSQTTAGLASYLLDHHSASTSPLRVVVGYDARKNSSVFAQDTSEVLSGYGIEVFLSPHEVPTPILAYAVRSLSCDAGVMVTASHNPAQDNGYKVYFGGADNGSQIIPPTAVSIERKIAFLAETETFSAIPRSQTLIRETPSSLVEGYISDTVAAIPSAGGLNHLAPVVYTPMHGVGGSPFLAAVKQAGLPPPIVVEEQFQPNAAFPTVAFPNPEEPGALDLSFLKAEEVGAALILAHDPDADRLAVALPTSSNTGCYVALSGNQVGAILGWQIAEKAHLNNQVGVLANSLVSSPVLGKIAQHFGLGHEETLTGFKYVSRVKNLIFGFEEALGYLVTPDVVKDKDGISAGLLILSLAHTFAAEDRTLWDCLHEIEEAVGAFASGQVTIRLSPGTVGSRINTALRERDIVAIGSRALSQKDDFLDGVGGFPQDDILRYYLEDGTRVIARPSGTEPKVKIYIDTEGETSTEALSRLKEVESDINELVSSL